MDNKHRIEVNKTGWGYSPNTSIDWDDPIARPAFYSDGKELPKGWKGEAELVWQYKWPNYKWDKCTDNDPKYAIAKGYETRQAYIAFVTEEKNNTHTYVEELAEKAMQGRNMSKPNTSYNLGFEDGYTAALSKNEGWVRVENVIKLIEAERIIAVKSKSHAGDYAENLLYNLIEDINSLPEAPKQ